jgi:type IV secretion system pilin
MLKKFFAIILVLVFAGSMNAGIVFAADDDDDAGSGSSDYRGLVPSSDEAFSIDECRVVLNLVEKLSPKEKNEFMAFEDAGGKASNDILACAIKTGDIHMWMVPFYIKYILEFVIGLSGLVCVGGIVYGGFVYIFSGIGDDKEKGKNAIMYSVIGLILTLLAWAIVNLVIALVTT